MEAILKFLTQSPILFTISVILLVAIVLSVIFIYISAFIQGREVSFWPPKIGENMNRPPNQCKDRYIVPCGWLCRDWRLIANTFLAVRLQKTIL